MRVLHIEPEDGEAARIAASLPAAFTLVRVTDAAAAGARLDDDVCDAVLARLVGDASEGLSAFAHVQASAGGLPIVVIVAREQEALGLKAVQLGAQDYLIDEQVHATLLSRCLRYAIECRRLRLELERRPRGSDESSAELAVTARLYGASALQDSLPAEFQQLVEAYGAALDMALEQRMYRIEHPVRDRLREIANRIGFLRGGARDVVDVHATALRGRENSGPRFRALSEEARLLLLEMMGHLVTYYRRYSLGGAAPSVQVRTGHAAPENGGTGG